jgi:hypothetical protein
MGASRQDIAPIEPIEPTAIASLWVNLQHAHRVAAPARERYLAALPSSMRTQLKELYPVPWHLKILIGEKRRRNWQKIPTPRALTGAEDLLRDVVSMYAFLQLDILKPLERDRFFKS